MNAQPCLVCPFYRQDPVVHTLCSHLRLKRIKDVKEHLAIRHADQLSEEQLRKLKHRARRGEAAELQWTMIHTICYPHAPRPPARSAFQGDAFEEVIGTVAGYFPFLAQAAFDCASATEAHQKQMVQAGIEGFLGGFLNYKNSIIGPTAPPSAPLLLDPRQGGPQGFAYAASTPTANATGVRYSAIPDISTASKIPPFVNAQTEAFGGLQGRSALRHPPLFPVDTAIQDFGLGSTVTAAARNLVTDPFCGYGTETPTEGLDFNFPQLSIVATFERGNPSPSDFLPNHDDDDYDEN